MLPVSAVSRGMRSARPAVTNVDRLPFNTIILSNVFVPNSVFKPTTKLFADVSKLEMIKVQL